MSKKGITIIIIVFVVIIGLLVAIIFNNKPNVIENKNILNNTETTENVNVIKNETLNEITEGTQIKDSKFKGYTAAQWKLLIEQFYRNYMATELDEIKCEYNKNGIYTATLSSQNVVCGEFLFDNETGYAKEKYSEITIDFIKGKFVNITKNEDSIFTENQVLAVGSIKSSKEEEFVEKYFNGQASYNTITTYDFRGEESRYNKYNEKFIFIPKDETVGVSIYKCKIEKDGSIKKESQLIENTSDVFSLIYDNKISENTKLCIEINNNGINTIVPILFNEDNKQLNLKGYESSVVDISMY